MYNTKIWSMRLKKFATLPLLLMLCLAGVAQNVLDEKISIKSNDQDTKAILGRIEKMVNVHFAYSPENMGDAKHNLNLRNEPLSVVLKQVLKKDNLAYNVQGNSIILYKSPAQVAPVDVTVSGRVVNARNEPLTGVSVTIKDNPGGTSTDNNGAFSLSVPDLNATLIFSYVGFASQEVNLQGRSSLNITMSATSSSLDEVVVVGYGTQKKSVVTGAISSVKASDLENQQIGRLEQALQGRATGLTIASSSGAPGSAATVRVRGITSLNDGANEPLYVVDGVVIANGNIDYLNPGDIESIEVLKDAASAAIYGARSAAGVILVTTKKGKAGDLRINYNGYYGFQGPAKKLNLLDATQYATLRNEQAQNDNTANLPFANPNQYGKGTDWQDEIFNNHAKIQNHESSLSGGGDRFSFYSSFGYFGQDGIVAPSISNFKRYNFRINSTYKITKWLSLGETLGYSHIDAKGSVGGNTDFGGPLSSAIMMDPITPVVITDPSVAGSVPYSSQPVIRNGAGNPYGISEYVAQQVTNPLAFIRTNEGNNTSSDDFVGNLFLEASPVKGLKFRSTIGSSLSFNGGENFSPIFYLNSNQLSTNTSFRRNSARVLNYNLENTVSYSNEFGEHNLTVLLGQGAYLDNNSRGLSVTYFNIPVNTFKEASLNYATAATDISANGYEGINHTVSSLFSRVTYSYADKYLFTGIVRRDGSSRFGPNNKFGYFPSASIGWVLSKESFFENNVANFLKLRGSYGVTGNDVLGNFRYLATVGGGRNYNFGYDNYLIGYSPDAPANPDLKWEQTSQLNFGLDAVMFRNWNLTLDWYKKKTTGILQTIQYPTYVGATGSSFGNVADMENTGFEMELGYKTRIGDVTLNLRGNASFLKNRVTFLGEEKEYLEGGAKLQNSTYELTRTAVGQAIGAFYGFQTLGVFQNDKEINDYVGPSGAPIQPSAVPGDFKWADLNNDGVISQEDRTFIGDPTPDWSYGITVNAGWRNFDLLVFGQGVAGNQIFQGLRRLDIPTANWQTDVLNRWTGEGTSNTYPRLSIKDPNKNNANPSDFHLQNGDYFRIKTLQIGYTLPRDLLTRAHLQMVRFYVSSNNLATITKYSGYDPEIGGTSYGIDRAIYPQARSFLLGVNFGF